MVVSALWVTGESDEKEDERQGEIERQKDRGRQKIREIVDRHLLEPSIDLGVSH